jgi:hypothetical protein
MLKAFTAVAAATAVILVSAAAAQAAAPANDAFAAAQPLTVGEQISAANLEATAEVPGEPQPGVTVKSSGCSNPEAAARCTTSVWYAFEPATSGEYTVETCDGGTDIDSVLAVYSGATLTTLTETGSDDDGCAGGYGDQGSAVSFDATGGTLYHVEVAGYGGDEGSFYVRAYAGPSVERPTPETSIDREDSYAFATNVGEGPGVLSGPRHNASFGLLSRTAGAGFECSLDDAAFTVCTTPISFDDLTAGSAHVFAARANVAGAIDPTPVVERFTIDTSQPDTFLTSGPRGPIMGQSPQWVTESTERNNNSSSYLCRLDGQVAFNCGPAPTVSELCNGPHTFSSAAVDRAANVDPVPTTAEIQVSEAPISCSSPLIEKPEVDEDPTEANLGVKLEDHGAGATLRLEYGTTSAYGTVEEEEVPADEGQLTRGFELRYLTPETTYHFNLRLTSPFGSVETGDATLLTAPLGTDTVPAIQNGTPNVTGAHAAAIPFKVDGHGFETGFSLRIAPSGPITAVSPVVSTSDDEFPEGLLGPQPEAIQVVDLDPSTTYHYRIAATQGDAHNNGALGPEGTFTTAPFVAVTASRSHFRLTRKNIKLGKLTRRTRVLRATVKGLPKGTVVRVKLKAGRRHIKARKKEKSRGTVKFKLRLSKKLRKALHDPKLKRAKVTFSAAPPGERTSRVVFKPKLKR